MSSWAFTFSSLRRYKNMAARNSASMVWISHGMFWCNWSIVRYFSCSHASFRWRHRKIGIKSGDFGSHDLREIRISVKSYSNLAIHMQLCLEVRERHFQHPLWQTYIFKHTGMRYNTIFFLSFYLPYLPNTNILCCYLSLEKPYMCKVTQNWVFFSSKNRQKKIFIVFDFSKSKCRYIYFKKIHR